MKRLLALAVCLIALPAIAGPLEYPVTRVESVVETLHGVPVADPYRWLEDGTNPEVQEWVGAQGALTRQQLDAIPGREALMTRLKDLYAVPYSFGPASTRDWLFFDHRDQLKDQPVTMVVRRGEPLANARVFIDPNTLSEDGTKAMDWMAPSHDGSLVAYGISESGTEITILKVRNTATGEDLSDEIPWTRSPSIAWLTDNSGFYYSRLPDPATVPAEDMQFFRQIYFHKLGTAFTKDPLVFGAGRPKTEWKDVASSADGRTLFLSTSIDWAKNDLWMRAADARVDAQWIPLAAGQEGLTNAYAVGDTLILVTNVDHPRYHILAAPLDDPDNRTEIIPEGPGVIDAVTIADGKLLVESLESANSKLRIYELDGTLLSEVTLPTLGTVASLAAEHDQPTVYFAFSSFAYPSSIQQLDIATGALSVVARMEVPFEPSDYEVRQEWATSPDGTRVPMFIVMKTGLPLDGSNPTQLSGYGGFDISLTPSFSRASLPWLDAGGILVTANLRGGGEFGSEWHHSGRLEKKQNVFDDFYACAEHLIAAGYTSSEKLAVAGGSNGGLLVGAALVQRPDLFEAAICAVPLLDMLRYDQFLLGSLWIPEYGTASNPDQFPFLRAYSPYHNIVEGTDYPSTLFMSGESDSRVDPLHARKMAAAMQAATGGDRPILLRVEEKAGHGQGTPLTKVLNEQADQYLFLAQALGFTGFPAPADDQ